MSVKIKRGRHYLLDGEDRVEVLGVHSDHPDYVHLAPGEVLYGFVDEQDAIDAGWIADSEGRYEAISDMDEFAEWARPAP